MAAQMKEEPFYTVFRGSFTGMLRWEDLDALWQTVHGNAAGWYVYAIGEAPPAAPAGAEEVRRFIAEVDALLRKEHEEDYCGIVYADSRTEPTMIKIFDPNNLGVSCGFSDNPPLPGWVLSRLPPVTLYDKSHRPENRRRWWRRLWS